MSGGKPAAQAAPDRGGERRLIFVLLVLYALGFLDRQVISLLLDPIGRDLGVSDVEMGFLQGMGFVLFFALCGPALGWMADRYPRRAIIWGGVTVWSLCTAAGGLAQTYHELLIARFGVGAGEAALLPAAYSMISDRVDKARLGQAMALFSLGVIFGGALSYGLGGAAVSVAKHYAGVDLPLLGPRHDWQLVFLGIGLVGLPLALLVFAVPEPIRRTSGSATTAAASGFAHFRRHWRFYAAHIAAFSLLCLICAAHVAWGATYLIRHYHWSVGEVGTVLAAMGLVAGGIGMYGSGSLADWLYRRGRRDAHLRLYVAAIPVMAAAAFAAYSGIGIAATLAGYVVLGIGAPFIAVAASALQLGTPPERRGLASAVFLMIYNIVGFGLGPALAALAGRELFGNDIGLGMVATWAVVAPLAVLFMLAGLGPMRRAVEDVSG